MSDTLTFLSVVIIIVLLTTHDFGDKSVSSPTISSESTSKRDFSESDQSESDIADSLDRVDQRLRDDTDEESLRNDDQNIVLDKDQEENQEQNGNLLQLKKSLEELEKDEKMEMNRTILMYTPLYLAMLSMVVNSDKKDESTRQIMKMLIYLSFFTIGFNSLYPYFYLPNKSVVEKQIEVRQEIQDFKKLEAELENMYKNNDRINNNN